MLWFVVCLSGNDMVCCMSVNKHMFFVFCKDCRMVSSVCLLTHYGLVYLDGVLSTIYRFLFFVFVVTRVGFTRVSVKHMVGSMCLLV